MATPRADRGLTLLESGRSLSGRRVGSILFGMTAHLIMVAGVLILISVEFRGAGSPEDLARAIFLAPENKPVASVAEERLLYAGVIGAADVLPPVNEAADGSEVTEVPVPEPGSGAGGSGEDVVDEAALKAAALEEIALSVIEVDSVVVPDPNSGGPEYPERLLLQRVEGAVLARFIVDSTGRAEPASFLAVQTSDTAFTSAVRRALPRMKFSPAKLRGAPVAQVVVQQFTFRVAGLPGDTLPADSLPADTRRARRARGDSSHPDTPASTPDTTLSERGQRWR